MMKRKQLVGLTLDALHVPITGRVFAAFLGSWNCHMQFRRPTYSVFQDVYVQQRSMPLDAIRPLSTTAKTELLVAICLAPGMITNCRAAICDKIYSTDASTQAGGITVADLPPWMKLTLYDLAEFGGAHVRLDTPCPLTGMDLVKGELVALLTIPLEWQTVIGYDFKFQEHINLLEMLVVVTLLSRLVKAKVSHQRVLVLIDSGVVKGAATKGRSSSRRLNVLLRRLASYILARDLYVEFLWLPSAANSSDAPSRHYPLGQWRASAVKYCRELGKVAGRLPKCFLA